MSRPKGSKNKTIENIVSNIEEKGLPPSFGRFESLIIAPRPLSNDSPSLIRLNTGWVSICVDKVASTMISLPLHMYLIKNDRKAKCAWKTKQLSNARKNLIKRNSNIQKIKSANDIEEIEEHLVWECLNNVNNDLNFDDLVKLVIQYLLLIGNAYIVIKKNGKVPYGIEVLPAEYTTVMLEKDSMDIVGYRVFNGIRERVYEKDEVIHFKRISSGMFWRIQSGELKTGIYGMGALESVLSEVMCNNAILDYERALMENMCIPAGIVNYTGGTLTPEAMKAAEASWKKALGGLKRAGTIKVTDQNWDFKPVQISPKDLSYEEGRKWLREVIANAFGVPVGLLSPTDSNRATSMTDMKNYYSMTIAPMCELIASRINTHLIPFFDDDLFVEFESPVKEDNEFELKETELKLKYCLISINEWRADQGLDPVPWGDEPMGQTSTHAQDENKVVEDKPPTTEEKTEEEQLTDPEEKE